VSSSSVSRVKANDRLYWNITGVEPSLYDVSLRAIDADAADAARAAAAQTASSSSLSSSLAPASTIRPSSSIQLSSASLSTALVGRELQIRQSATGNLTIADGHNAQEPITFVVTLPPGRYYFAGWINTSPRTAANSNVFRVVEGDDMSCLTAGATTSTTATSGTSSAGTQTAGSANNATETSSISGGAIAGIVIGVLGGLAVLGALLFFCMKKKRRQNRAMNANRFSNLPSASSQDGGEYGQHPLGHAPIAGAWRRDSDPDEKDPRPHPVRSDSDDPTPSLGDRRKQAGPPTSHTLAEKKSTQGFIGKGSNESSAVHSRSSSIGGGEGVPQVGGGGGVKQVGRSTSVKRKPVPSLGPELRSQLERERKMSASNMGGGEANRKSYSLVPDLPTPHK
jgi:hypothetical protein